MKTSWSVMLELLWSMHAGSSYMPCCNTDATTIVFTSSRCQTFVEKGRGQGQASNTKIEPFQIPAQHVMKLSAGSQSGWRKMWEKSIVSFGADKEIVDMDMSWNEHQPK